MSLSIFMNEKSHKGILSTLKHTHQKYNVLGAKQLFLRLCIFNVDTFFPKCNFFFVSEEQEKEATKK